MLILIVSTLWVLSILLANEEIMDRYFKFLLVEIVYTLSEMLGKRGSLDFRILLAYASLDHNYRYLIYNFIHFYFIFCNLFTLYHDCSPISHLLLVPLSLPFPPLSLVHRNGDPPPLTFDPSVSRTAWFIFLCGLARPPLQGEAIKEQTTESMLFCIWKKKKKVRSCHH